MTDNALIVRCLKCGRKNRIDPSGLDRRPVCGACRSALDELIFHCLICGTKNRIPEDRIHDRPICGRCRLPLYRSTPSVIRDSDFQEEVLSFPGAAMVGLFAREIDLEQEKMMNYFARKFAGGVKVIRLSAGEGSSVVQQFSDGKVPALLIFCNGRLVERLAGKLLRDEIEARLIAHMEDCTSGEGPA